MIHLLFCWAIGLTPPDSLGTAEVTAVKRVVGVNTPVSVQRIAATDIEKRGITDIGDALRRFSGVNLRDYGGAGGLKTVSVRGMGAAHTVVTYDGLAVTDTRQGQTDMGQFSLDKLSSLELRTLDNEQLLCPVRSMAAATVSMHSAWNERADTRWHATIGMKLGSFGTYNPSLLLGKKVSSKTLFNVSQDFFYANNNYPFTINNGVATTRLHRNNSRMQTSTSEINVRSFLSPAYDELQIKAYFSHNYRHLPGMVRYYVNNNNERLKEQTAFAQAVWKKKIKRFHAFAAGKYNWQKSFYENIDNQYPGGALHQHYWQRETYVTAGIETKVLQNLHTSYATDYAYSSLNSNLTTDRDASRHNWSQAFSMRYKTEHLTLMARGIYHLVWNEKEGGESAKDASRFTPSLTATALLLREPLWIYLRAGYKESFRMPTFTESYYYHLGSKTLKPELSHQYSLGFTCQASPCKSWPLLAVTLDGYYNRISDKIVSVPYNLFVWHTVNMGDVRTFGLDVTLQSKWQISKRQSLLLVTNYTLQQCRDYTSSKLSTWHKQLAYTPLHSGAASLTWENPWASLALHSTFASKRWCSNNHLPTTDLPAYSDWGLSVYHTFNTRRSALSMQIELNNIFDHHYEIIGLYPMPGRAYKITLKYSF